MIRNEPKEEQTDEQKTGNEDIGDCLSMREKLLERKNDKMTEQKDDEEQTRRKKNRK